VEAAISDFTIMSIGGLIFIVVMAVLHQILKRVLK